jgi:nucleotide-binding universal stress UspA family protein
MRVLYCLDGTNVAEVSQARVLLSASEPQTLGILYVIDSGPREDLGRVRERFFRRPDPPPSREEEILQTERASAKDILEEGLRHFPDAEPLERQGRPEREIVNSAAEWRADLLVICPRSQFGGKPGIGPKSVGHVARFVLDHAPCPVLLVRPPAKEQFPIAR